MRGSRAKTRDALLTMEALISALRVSEGAVLVGGQALAFWVDYFGLTLRSGPQAFVSREGDFLGRPDHVKRFAAAVGGHVEMAPNRGLSALHGAVVRRGRRGPEVLIDVLNSVIGIDNDEVRRRAVRVTHLSDPSVSFDVMDPLSCLVSRFENLRQLDAKRNDVGVWQARIALDVCRAYLEKQLANDNERLAIRTATAVLRLAGSAAGLQAYRRYDLELLEAIPVEHFNSAAFRETQYVRVVSRIRRLRADFQQPPRAGTSGTKAIKNPKPRA